MFSKHAARWIILLVTAAAAPMGASARDTEHVLSVDHRVEHPSTIPGITGDVWNFVRERVVRGRLEGGPAEGKVVLFIGTGGDAADVFYDSQLGPDYSLLAFLAQRGFDAFSMDLVTVGRSSRPAFMDDRCNLRRDVQRLVFGSTCAPSHDFIVRNSRSDVADVDAVVEYLRHERGVARVHVVGFSSGGRLAIQYAVAHPEKVDRLVLLAPSYTGFRHDEIAESLFPLPIANKIDGGAVWARAWKDVPPLGPTGLNFIDQWATDPNTCAGQIEEGIQEAVWADLQTADPLGAYWGAGVGGFVRTTATTVHGFSPARVLGILAPTLVIAGDLDAATGVAQSRSLFEAITNAPARVLLTLACASHYVMFEKQRYVLQDAIHKWLLAGRLHGTSCGEVRADGDGRVRRATSCERGPE